MNPVVLQDPQNFEKHPMDELAKTRLAWLINYIVESKQFGHQSIRYYIDAITGEVIYKFQYSLDY